MQRRSRSNLPGIAGIALATALMTASVARAQESPRRWAFVNPQAIITAEATGAHKFILNFINLSDFVVVIQANDFLYKGASGQPYIGQVFDQETRTTRGEVFRYSASVLIGQNSFKGLNVLGAFGEQDRIQELYVRIGSRHYFLKGLDRNQFEKLQENIETVDLKNSNTDAALRSAGLTEMGSVKMSDGSPDWDLDWQGQLRPDGVNPPRMVETPAVSPTEEARKNNIYGAVKLSATITRDGNIENITVVKGLGFGLDERALEAVKASWVFLPATLNGEVVETKAQFEVPFPPPKK